MSTCQRGGYFEALDRAAELIGRPVDLIELVTGVAALVGGAYRAGGSAGAYLSTLADLPPP